MDTTQINSESFIDYLCYQLNQYITHSKKSISNIAQIVGIDRRTLVKINPTYDLSNISPTKIAKLIHLIDKKNSHLVIKRFKTELSDISINYKSYFSGFKVNEPSDLEKENNLIKISKDRTKFLIYSMATTKLGITLKEITSIFGDEAAGHLEDLLHSNMILSRDNRYYKSEKERMYFGPEHEKDILCHLSTKYNYKHANQKRNIGIHAVESVNKETLIKVQSILLNAFTEVNELIRKDCNKGKIPFFTGIVMDTFNNDLPPEGELQ